MVYLPGAQSSMGIYSQPCLHASLTLVEAVRKRPLRSALTMSLALPLSSPAFYLPS